MRILNSSRVFQAAILLALFSTVTPFLGPLNPFSFLFNCLKNMLNDWHNLNKYPRVSTKFSPKTHEFFKGLPRLAIPLPKRHKPNKNNPPSQKSTSKTSNNLPNKDTRGLNSGLVNKGSYPDIDNKGLDSGLTNKGSNQGPSNKGSILGLGNLFNGFGYEHQKTSTTTSKPTQPNNGFGILQDGDKIVELQDWFKGGTQKNQNQKATVEGSNKKQSSDVNKNNLLSSLFQPMNSKKVENGIRRTEDGSANKREVLETLPNNQYDAVHSVNKAPDIAAASISKISTGADSTGPESTGAKSIGAESTGAESTDTEKQAIESSNSENIITPSTTTEHASTASTTTSNTNLIKSSEAAHEKFDIATSNNNAENMQSSSDPALLEDNIVNQTPHEDYSVENSISNNVEKSATEETPLYPDIYPRNIRLDCRLLTKEQWRQYYTAVQDSMKIGPDPESPRSWYDVFAGYHRYSEAPAAHNGPGFLAWHSIYCHSFETMLRNINPNVTVPVWDTRPDTEIPNHCDSCLYTSELLGNNQGIVRIGPFKNRQVFPEDCGIYETGPWLTRECQQNSNYMLFNYEEFDYVLNNFNTYGDFCIPLNDHFENNHGLLHVANGGHLNHLSCSPNDPAFYMLHAFVHAMFDITVDKMNETQQLEMSYPSRADIVVEHRGDSPAKPFDVPLAQCLKESIQRDMKYILVPPHCDKDEECNPTRSDMNAFWCKTTSRRCASKIRIGGVCVDSSGTYPHKSCFRQSFCANEPTCSGGICVCTTNDGTLITKPPTMEL